MKAGNTTWKQLTIMTKMACGAHKPVLFGDDGEHLRFKVGGKRMTYLEVELAPTDTYTARLVRWTKKYERVVMEEVTGVYVDCLNETVYGLCNK